MSVCIAEQETIVNFQRGDKRATVYTSDTNMMFKFDKLVDTSGSEWKLEKVSKVKDEIVAKEYSCPVEFITYRKKRRHLTEEHKNKLIKSKISSKTHTYM